MHDPDDTCHNEAYRRTFRELVFAGYSVDELDRLGLMVAALPDAEGIPAL